MHRPTRVFIHEDICVISEHAILPQRRCI